MNYDKIGEFISKLRKEKNLTQKELAIKLGVTDKAVSKWERGLGCPDVSILEILSKELGVSILEILKGRIIENEVIAITELNDYVLDTVQFSKNELSRKYRSILNSIISVIIIGICSFLLIVNINHIIYLNRSGLFNDNYSRITTAKYNLELVNKNIKKIKNSKGKYNEEDYSNIVTYIEDNYNIINSNEMIEYSANQKIYLRDLYNINIKMPNNFYTIKIYNILLGYDIKLKDEEIINQYISFNINNELSYQYNYKYNLIDLSSDSEEMNLDNEISNMSYALEYYSNQLLDITNRIIEVGDINE